MIHRVLRLGISKDGARLTRLPVMSSANPQLFSFPSPIKKEKGWDEVSYKVETDIDVRRRCRDRGGRPEFKNELGPL